MLWRSKSALMKKSIEELVDATIEKINFIHGLINDKSIIINKDMYIVSKEDINKLKELLVCIANKADNKTFIALQVLYTGKINPNSLYEAASIAITDGDKNNELQSHKDSPLIQKLDNLQELYFQKFSFYDDIILPIKNVFNRIITKTTNFILRREEPVLSSNVQEQLKAKIEELSNVTLAERYNPNYSEIATNYTAGLIHSNINQNTQKNPLGQPKKDDVENSNQKKKSFGMSSRYTIS